MYEEVVVLNDSAKAGTLIIKIVKSPSLLNLENLYSAIRIDSPDSDRRFVLSEVLSPRFTGWLIFPLSPRVCLQRRFYMWGDSSVRVSFGINTRERPIGPFHLPPSSGEFEFTGALEKHTLYIYRENVDARRSAELHIIVFAVMPLVTHWEQYWKPQLLAEVAGLKGMSNEV